MSRGRKEFVVGSCIKFRKNSFLISVLLETGVRNEGPVRKAGGKLEYGVWKLKSRLKKKKLSECLLLWRLRNFENKEKGG